MRLVAYRSVRTDVIFVRVVDDLITRYQRAPVITRHRRRRSAVASLLVVLLFLPYRPILTKFNKLTLGLRLFRTYLPQNVYVVQWRI